MMKMARRRCRPESQITHSDRVIAQKTEHHLFFTQRIWAMKEERSRKRNYCNGAEGRDKITR
jgi:hypothetical protein